MVSLQPHTVWYLLLLAWPHLETSELTRLGSVGACWPPIHTHPPNCRHEFSSPAAAAPLLPPRTCSQPGAASAPLLDSFPLRRARKPTSWPGPRLDLDRSGEGSGAASACSRVPTGRSLSSAYHAMGSNRRGEPWSGGVTILTEVPGSRNEKYGMGYGTWMYFYTAKTNRNSASEASFPFPGDYGWTRPV